MPDAEFAASVSAGLMCGCSVLVAGLGPPRFGARWRLGRWRSPAGGHLRIAACRAWLIAAIDRAGWRETPERLVVFGLAVAASAAAICGSAAPWLAPFGFIAALGGGGLAMASAIERRRRRLAGELVPLLELFTLELSAGGSALSALGSVTVQVEGELAAGLRRMLIASQVSGSQSFEARLLEYSEQIRIPALGT